MEKWPTTWSTVAIPSMKARADMGIMHANTMRALSVFLWIINYKMIDGMCYSGKASLQDEETHHVANDPKEAEVALIVRLLLDIWG